MTKITNTKFRIVFIVVAVILAGIFYVYREPINHSLSSLSLIPDAEKFTELYFENYPSLSREDISRGKSISFSFSVRNFEGEDKEYAYRVFLASSNAKEKAGSRVSIKEGSLFVKAGEKGTLSLTYTLPSSFLDGAIHVELLEKNQSIHFLIPDR